MYIVYMNREQSTHIYSDCICGMLCGWIKCIHVYADLVTEFRDLLLCLFSGGTALAGCVREGKLVVSSNELPCHKIGAISVGREGGKEEGREGGREGRRKGGKEEGREGGKEERREGGREGRRVSREGGKGGKRKEEGREGKG